MKSGYYGLALCLLFFAVGCTAVYSPCPVGNAPVAITPADWEGNWIHPEGFLTLKVVDESRGLLEMRWVEDDKIETSQVHILSAGDGLFGSIADEADSKRYLWAKIRVEDDQMILWIPKVEKFKPLVEKKILPGKIDDDGNVTLAKLTKEQMEILNSEDHGVLFEWEAPVVLMRMFK